MKDRDSFDECLRENDVIPTREERQRIKEKLKEKKHRKLILRTDQPTDYWLIDANNSLVRSLSLSNYWVIDISIA